MMMLRGMFLYWLLPSSYHSIALVLMRYAEVCMLSVQVVNVHMRGSMHAMDPGHMQAGEDQIQVCHQYLGDTHRVLLDV